MYNEYLFIEMSDDELSCIDGGIGFWAGVLIGTVVCIGYDVGNEALKNKTGKDIGDWVTYGLGYGIDKVGDGLRYVGNALN